jgi:hypothetical protein
MYKIIGSDGKEYGPISLEQLQQWRAEGRINARTRVLGTGGTEWKTAADFPELGFAMPPGIPVPGISPPPPALPTEQKNGLAITSFVLGLVSLFLCFFAPLAGIPAIVCGHIAHARTRRASGQFGGSGFAIAGFVLGYCGLLVCLASFGLYSAYRQALGAVGGAKDRAQSINCVNNMKQIGLAFRTWELDNKDQFPFNLSATNGGTMEFCLLDSKGFDQNAFLHFRVMSNELSTPRLLACPADLGRQPAMDFTYLQPANVSYQVYSGTNVNDMNPQQALAVCPIHGHVLLCDGSVQQKSRSRK